MKVADIQNEILEQTGLKTSVKRMSGSMKHHIKIWPIFQNGAYQKFPIEWVREYIKQFKSFGETSRYGTPEELNIPTLNFSDITPIVYKKERKPKPIDPDKPVKGWGSKNSQIRLDKAATRYAKALRRGENRARYY